MENWSVSPAVTETGPGGPKLNKSDTNWEVSQHFQGIFQSFRDISQLLQGILPTFTGKFPSFYWEFCQLLQEIFPAFSGIFSSFFRDISQLLQGRFPAFTEKFPSIYSEFSQIFLKNYIKNIQKRTMSPLSLLFLFDKSLIIVKSRNKPTCTYVHNTYIFSYHKNGDV